jgi:hypothetical protein
MKSIKEEEERLKKDGEGEEKEDWRREGEEQDVKWVFLI